MSGYYASITNISGKKSSVATSAYMSREELKDETMQHTFNYSHHEHDNTFSNVCLCKNAPEEWQDKAKLWNAVEEQEQGKNARKAKQWILAIPPELIQEQREKAVVEFQEFLAENGMCSQADIHEPDSKRSALKVEKNLHVHVLATQRLINEHGEWEQIKIKQEYANDVKIEDGKEKPFYNPEKPNDTAHRIPKVDPEKVKAWEERNQRPFEMAKATAEDKAEVQKIGARNRKEWVRVTTESNPLYRAELIEESRKVWAEVCNKYLSAEQQIDHRSYDRQGIDKVAQIHEGVGYHHQDERAEYNKVVVEVNENMELMKEQAPETVKEIRSRLDEVRASLEHDGNSIRTGEAIDRTARPDRASEERIGSEKGSNIVSGEEIREARRTPSVSAFELEEHAKRVRGKQFEESSKAEHDRRGTSYDLGKVGSIREEQQAIITEQRELNSKIGSLGEKVKELAERIKAKAQELASHLKPKPKDQGEERIMSTMSRFSQISAEQKQAREENMHSGASETAQKDSVLAKLEKYKQMSKEQAQEGSEATQEQSVSSAMQKFNKASKSASEGRTEPLQSETKQAQEETQHQHRRRGIRR